MNTENDTRAVELSTCRTAFTKNSSQRNKTVLFQSSHISVQNCWHQPLFTMQRKNFLCKHLACDHHTLLAWQWKYSITEQRPNLQQGLNVPSPNTTIDNTVIMALCEASVRLRSYLIINAVWTLWWPWDQSALLYNRMTCTGLWSLPFFLLWHTEGTVSQIWWYYREALLTLWSILIVI